MPMVDNIAFRSFRYSKCAASRAQMEVDIRNYDMHEVVMAPEGKFLYLKVPGLSENR